MYKRIADIIVTEVIVLFFFVRSSVKRKRKKVNFVSSVQSFCSQSQKRVRLRFLLENIMLYIKKHIFFFNLQILKSKSQCLFSHFPQLLFGSIRFGTALEIAQTDACPKLDKDHKTNKKTCKMQTS